MNEYLRYKKEINVGLRQSSVLNYDVEFLI